MQVMWVNVYVNFHTWLSVHVDILTCGLFTVLDSDMVVPIVIPDITLL